LDVCTFSIDFFQASSAYGGLRTIDEDTLIYDVGAPPKLKPFALIDSNS
jgi:hypothetical protein